MRKKIEWLVTILVCIGSYFLMMMSNYTISTNIDDYIKPSAVDTVEVRDTLFIHPLNDSMVLSLEERINKNERNRKWHHRRLLKLEQIDGNLVK